MDMKHIFLTILLALVALIGYGQTDSTKVKKAVLFSTSWISKHALDLMRRKLTDKGIEVDEKTLYFKSREAAAGRQKAQAFAKQFL